MTTERNPTGTNDRMAEFEAEIGSLKLKGGDAKSEQRLLTGGAVAMGVGVALAVMTAILTSSTADSAAQRAYIAQGALLGTAIILVGAALFVRYSLGRYLRFWMIRLVYEERANTDRIVDAIERAAGPR